MQNAALSSKLAALALAAMLAAQALLACPSLAADEELRIRIENQAGGAIAVSRTSGEKWLRIGTVVKPANTVNPKGYNASRWVPDSTVAATAVNAIHITVRTDQNSGRGVIFSIVPAGQTVGAAADKPSSSIVTDSGPGQGIFGGVGPYVASAVYLQADNGALGLLDAQYQPSPGDVLVITRLRPSPQVRYLDFENKFGGFITVTYCGGKSEVIGQVLKPVVGIGRFEGTVHAAPGRLRANHAGVIDVSTSPLGSVGGFQIVPRRHANDPEVWYIRSKTQWIVVGPLDARQPSWEGTAPLFSAYLYPSYRSDDITGRHKDWLQRALSRCQVLAKRSSSAGGAEKAGPWQLLPRIALDPAARAEIGRPKEEGTWRIKASFDPSVSLPPAAATALSDVTDIRMVLPRQVYWPGEPEGSDSSE